MSEAEFTPGPWIIDPRCLTRVMQSANHNRGIAACGGYYSNQTDTTPENAANAKLIAAAPDLYATLQASTELLYTWRTGMNGKYDATLENQIAANEAALKKAEGTT